MGTKGTPPISISLLFILKMENKLDHVKLIGVAVKMVFWFAFRS